MLLRITKIDPMSLAKTFLVLQGMIGFIFGIILSMGAIIQGPDAGSENPFGVWSFIVFPLLNSVIGFISGLLLAYLYNFLTKFIGGIQLDMEQ